MNIRKKNESTKLLTNKQINELSEIKTVDRHWDDNGLNEVGKTTLDEIKKRISYSNPVKIEEVINKEKPRTFRNISRLSKLIKKRKKYLEDEEKRRLEAEKRKFRNLPYFPYGLLKNIHSEVSYLIDNV